ncbi:MAG TPA: transcription termination/antitermination protein NusA [Gammaproteobacteria bacterium]|jgi:N utilization substance protein A|nr:transcription termination/antitermination protein NusA [Gammaproteobacteria bacterium]HIK76897.1 transcription termination/antitermination protein NusA [Gammaproteobacteria bacterium]
MAAEIIKVVDAVSEAKDVDREVLFEAIENAIESATKKKYADTMDVKVTIDRETGDYKTYRRWMVFADDSRELEDPDIELRMIDAVDVDKNANPGEFVHEEIESVDFGRIGAQIAKQVIVQKVREAEKQKTIELFKDNVGELVSGVVKRMDRNGFYIDIGNNAEAFLPRREMIYKEAIRPQDRIKAILKDINTDLKGPPLILSRIMPEFLIELFKLEVPEITQNLISIVGASRDPGLRAKIAVQSDDKRIDPVGACVGMRGSRVQAVSNELNGERIDIILWSDNTAQYVVNAMSPANVVSIVVDEENNSMDIAVEEAKLSQAIGRGGQNIRLASELTNWKLNVLSETEALEKDDQELKDVSDLFVETLSVGEDVAILLAQEGFASIEQVAYVPVSELEKIDGFDEKLVNELRERAQDQLLIEAISTEEDLDKHGPDEDLLSLESVTEELAYALARSGIYNKDKLADQSVDEIIEIEGIDEELAGIIIMEARADWFKDDQNND